MTHKKPVHPKKIKISKEAKQCAAAFNFRAVKSQKIIQKYMIAFALRIVRECRKEMGV